MVSPRDIAGNAEEEDEQELKAGKQGAILDLPLRRQTPYRQTTKVVDGCTKLFQGTKEKQCRQNISMPAALDINRMESMHSTSARLPRSTDTIRPKIHGYTGCKRTCAAAQAVSCI